MKIWIMHNSKFGNGKEIANVLKNQYEPEYEVEIGNANEISPKTIIKENIVGIVLITKAERFMSSITMKRWLKKISKLYHKSNNLQFGIMVMTHAMNKDNKLIQKLASNYHNKMEKSSIFNNIYPNWISWRVPNGYDHAKKNKYVKLETEMIRNEFTLIGTETLAWIKSKKNC